MTIPRNICAALIALPALAIAEGAVEGARHPLSILNCAELVVVLLAVAVLVSTLQAPRGVANRVFAIATMFFVPTLGICLALALSRVTGIAVFVLGLIPFVLYIGMYRSAHRQAQGEIDALAE